MPGDNYHFDICSEGRKHFDLAMEFAFAGHGCGPVKGYRISPKKGMILYWADSKKLQPLPYPMEKEAVKEFVWGWLQTANFGGQPDHDGDNGRGWRIYNEAWTHVDGEWEAFVGVEPAWQMYGK